MQVLFDKDIMNKKLELTQANKLSIKTKEQNLE